MKGGRNMNKKKLLMKGAVFLVTVGLLLALPRGHTFAAEAKLVNIHPVGEGNLVGFYLDPANLQISKNTIVVWLSGVQGEDVQVIFMEGKTCKDVSANPKAFNLDSKGCYVSSFISYAETSSLQFVEPGTYQYYVATATGNIKAKGSIIVRGE